MASRVPQNLLDVPVDADLATKRYRMDSECKGMCLIINNITIVGQAPLEDGAVTGRMLTDTFKQLGFHIVYEENASSERMHQLMGEIQNEDHRKYSCFVCCISSHGNEKGVSGTDGELVEVNALRKYFYSTQCQQLAGKPKVFFVEACRGGEIQERLLVDTVDSTGDPDGSWKVRLPYPPTYRWEMDEDHFLMSYATTPDHVAMYHTERGGNFFRCLTTNLLAHAATLPVDDILMLVGDRLRELGAEQTSICESTLKKKLYFSNDQSPTRGRATGAEPEAEQAREDLDASKLS